MTDRSLSADARAHAARAAGQPQPDLREQLRRAVAEAGFWQYASLEPHDFRDETDAVLAVVQPLLDAKQDEVDALTATINRVRQALNNQSWRASLDVTISEALGEPVAGITTPKET